MIILFFFYHVDIFLLQTSELKNERIPSALRENLWRDLRGTLKSPGILNFYIKTLTQRKYE